MVVIWGVICGGFSGPGDRDLPLHPSLSNQAYTNRAREATRSCSAKPGRIRYYELYTMAEAKEISMDAVLATVLSEPGGIFTIKELQKRY